MARPTTGRNGKATNLYIDKQVVEQGKQTAKERYGMSLSDMVQMLIKKEMSLKRGLLTRS